MDNQTGRGPTESNRAEAFSDGVFAIAITLLVLELAIPQRHGQFASDLVSEWVSYVSYLAAFGTIGVLWLGHHTIFTRIQRVDTGLLWRNLVLLLTTSVFPFPTAVIASAYRAGSRADQAAAVISYAVVGIGSGVAWLLVFTYLTRHRELLRDEADLAFFGLRGPLVTIIGYAAAGLLGWLLNPALALGIFLFFPVFYIITLRRETDG